MEQINPIIKADFPDPDVIRVEDTYYMICTTMHFFPGGIILRSYDLILDHPELKCLEVFKECRLLMHGNRLRLLYILLSFIGYGLLVLCSFGIASLWVVPYQTETLVIFYLDCTDELNRIPVRSYEKTATTQF